MNRERVKPFGNSKIPMKIGWLEAMEEESIEKMLSANLNYSIKTGETLGKGIRLDSDRHRFKGK